MFPALLLPHGVLHPVLGSAVPPSKLYPGPVYGIFLGKGSLLVVVVVVSVAWLGYGSL